MIRFRTSTVLIALVAAGHLWTQNRKMREALLRHNLALPPSPLVRLVNSVNEALEKARQRRVARQIIENYSHPVDRPVGDMT